MRFWGAALLACAACATPRVHRTAEPLVLVGDPPQTPCERERWLQLAPTHAGVETAETVAQTTRWIMYDTYDVAGDGLAAYRGKLTLRLTREQTEKILGSQLLRPDIAAQVHSIHKQQAIHNGFLFGGLAATVAGGAITLADLEKPTAGLAIMGVGLVAELIGVMIRPHNAEVAWADVRDHVFVSGEADETALATGVERVNKQTRGACR